MNDAKRAMFFHYRWEHVPGSIYFTGVQVKEAGSSKVVYPGVHGRIYAGNKIEWTIANVVCTATMNNDLTALTDGEYHEIDGSGNKVTKVGDFIGLKSAVFQTGASLEYHIPNAGWVPCTITGSSGASVGIAAGSSGSASRLAKGLFPVGTRVRRGPSK